MSILFASYTIPHKMACEENRDEEKIENVLESLINKLLAPDSWDSFMAKALEEAMTCTPCSPKNDHQQLVDSFCCWQSSECDKTILNCFQNANGVEHI